MAPDKIFHLTVAPCYDRKMEALREDYYTELHNCRDVDCVLTSGEGSEDQFNRTEDIHTMVENSLAKYWFNPFKLAECWHWPSRLPASVSKGGLLQGATKCCHTGLRLQMPVEGP